MWDLPGSGIKSMSPVLAGGFFTSQPPGKPLSQTSWKSRLHWLSLYVSLLPHVHHHYLASVPITPLELLSPASWKPCLCALLLGHHPAVSIFLAALSSLAPLPRWPLWTGLLGLLLQFLFHHTCWCSSELHLHLLSESARPFSLWSKEDPLLQTTFSDPLHQRSTTAMCKTPLYSNMTLVTCIISTSGVVCFLCGLQSPGHHHIHPWCSGHWGATGCRERQKPDCEGPRTFLLRTLGFILHEMKSFKRTNFKHWSRSMPWSHLCLNASLHLARDSGGESEGREIH